MPFVLPPAAVAASAQPALKPARFNIAAGPLDAALVAFARQGGVQLLYEHRLAQGRVSPGLHGTYPPAEALSVLLGDAPLSPRFGASNVVVLAPKPDPVGAGAPPQAEAAPPLDPAAEVAPVVVTGTLIRGVGAGPSPVRVTTRDAMDRAGQASVADALSALPQAFNGVSTPQTLLLGADGLGTNETAATGVNLRGLGATSTLVLVDGRRIAGSGLKGDFVDVSAIPTAAVDRIEVLLDGASALYGSDAVGGVVNVILRKDFSGAETRLRGGAARGGDASDVTLGQTLGRTWSGGHLLLSYEYADDGRLPSADRAATASTDLRPLGGSDHRLPYALPGNLLSFDPVTQALIPAYAIPAIPEGRALTPSDFQPGTANLENIRALADTLPAQTRHSLYLNAEQALSSRVELGIDARYSRRDVRFASPEALSVLSVTPANPYYVSPDGAPSELIGYAFGAELGPERNHALSESYGVSADLSVDFAADWRIEATLSWAQSQERLATTGLVNDAFLDEALGTTPDVPDTPYSLARDGAFNPYGAGSANSRAVLDFIGSGTSLNRTLDRIWTLDLKADGRLLNLPGGPLRLAAGAQLRDDGFVTSTISQTDGPQPITSSQGPFNRTIGAVFAELRVPLVGAANSRSGLQRLELSLAGRIEHYSDVGLQGTPKLGVLWTPWRGLDVRATYSQSFRAPSLPEVGAAQLAAPAFAPRGSDQVLTLVRYGGNLALRPETADVWSGGVTYAPPVWPGLTLTAGFFDITYRDRVGQPVFEDFANALQNPAYSPFVSLVSPGTNAADRARVQALIDASPSSSAALFPADAYAAIIDARYVNAASLHTQGVDLSAAYGRRFGPHRLDLSFDGTILDDFSRRLTPDAVSEPLAGRAGQPASVRLRSRLDWSWRTYNLGFGVNRTSGALVPSGGQIDGWTTVDLTAGWTPSTAAAHGVALTLTVQNLLDADPPFYDSPFGVAYDPANANVLGRAVALQLSARW